ncbi:MAG: 3-phosphoshikimate 1-carboxyvinyltransferase [Clostridia bacterium]|nr:3-phosphoshikimate 1-carboxyvinyltransferase [Clostridia bacterium]
MNYKVKNVYGKTNNKEIIVTVPGSKSITARALLIAAIANGESVLSGAQFSNDCATFLKCLTDLKIKAEVNGTTVKICGCNGVLPAKKAEIYVGSAGTAARFIPAFLAFQSGEYTLNCSEQMKTRPVKPLINTLSALGAKFEFHEKENAYPFTIFGASNPATAVNVDISESSQFLSALLISAACAKKTVKISPYGSHGLDYVKMTVNMMRSFGAAISENDGDFTVSGGYSAQNYEIEPDLSAASYFYAMNKILDANICVEGVGENSVQGDYKFIKLLQNFEGGKIDMGSFSDQALTLAAIAPYLKEPTEICGVAHIRRQECDRIAAIVQNLTAMGVKCEEFPDGVKICPSKPQPATIKTFGDHRVAMSFALTGLRADGIVIENCEVCAKTFADYFDILEEVTAKLTK